MKEKASMTTQDVLKDGEGLRLARDGQAVRIVKDKSGVFVPMMMMDAVRDTVVTDDLRFHRPGAHLTADAKASEARQSTYDAYVKDLGEAWRSPDPTPVVARTKPPVTTDARETAHAEMVRNLENAWRAA
jgi:hypothetical protein